jgi:glycosyltransferase involved in cell wall biosynthesis
MLVSVIVPIYNSAPYLSRCVSSILNQTYRKIEIILVDDGSDDNSLILCYKLAESDERIKVISKSNGGASSARNIGLDNATGEYGIFVDSDDEITKDLVEYLVSLALNYGADVVACRYQYLKEDMKANGNACGNFVTESVQILTESQAIQSMLYQQSVESGPVGKLFSARTVADERFFTDISIAEDLEFNCRIFLKSNLVIQSSREMYIYWQREDSAINTGFKPSRMSSLLAMARIEETLKHNPELKKAIRRRYFIEAFSILEKLYLLRSRFTDEYRICVDTIVRYRACVASDSVVPVRHRLAAIMSYISIPLLMNLHFTLKAARTFKK